MNFHISSFSHNSNFRLVHYVTPFDSHVLSLSDRVNNNNNWFTDARYRKVNQHAAVIHNAGHLCILTRLFRHSHPDDNLMLHQPPLQRDHATGHTLTIHLHPGDTALAAVRILHLDRVDRFTVPIAEAEARP